MRGTSPRMTSLGCISIAADASAVRREPNRTAVGLMPGIHVAKPRRKTPWMAVEPVKPGLDDRE
jgi:hypothetical protein